MHAATETRALQQILQRERLARKEAEKILEAKAAELQEANKRLLALNKNLEETVRERTREILSIARFAQENPDPVVRISFAGDLVHQNPSAEALLQNFVYKNKRYAAADFWRQLVTDRCFSSPRLSFEAQCADRKFLFTCAPHSAEGYINVYGCDVTEQRKAQQALEESEQKWHFALKAAGDGVWEYNLVTRQTTFSRSYKEMLGFEGEAFLNHERLWRSRIHPDDIHLIDKIICDYADGTITQHSTQYRIRKKSGNYLWILDRGTLLDRTAAGQPLKIIGVHTNIDQQKKLELNFQSTANRLSTLVASLHLGIAMEDESGAPVVMNKKMCDLFGLDHAAQKSRQANMTQMAAQVAHLFFEPDRFLESHHELTQARRPVTGERWELTDGRTVSRSYLPVHSAEGQFQGNLWVLKDVTEQTANEKTLNKQRRFYEHILNSIPADVAVFDAAGEYLFLNPHGTRNEVRQRGLFKKNKAFLHHPQNQAAYAGQTKKFAEAMQAKKLLRWEEETVSADGKKAYALRNLHPVLNADGDVEMMIAYGLDITERKEIEQKIQRSEKKYRDLINFSYALITTHDTEGRLLSVNPSVCRTLEYTYAELLGKRIADFMPPEDGARAEAAYLQEITNNHVAEGVFRVVSKSGRTLYLLYKNYLFLEDGENPYIIGFAQDITERVKAEKELRLAKKATEEAAVAKERFLADMSHEIRTPMNGILGLASLLEKTPLNSTQREQLGLLKESAGNLLVIVNDVLDLEKIVSGKMELERIPFSVPGKVALSVASFQFRVQEKGIALRYHNHLPETLLVCGDPYRLGQILNNLLSNALKFTNEGEISLTTRCQPEGEGRVRVTYEVRDTGIGIPPDKQVLIFDPYVQARPEISRKYGGTGLGLAICKNLVEMQNGRLQVESEVGKGSVFSFSVSYELAGATQPATPAKPVCENTVLSGKTVLVAEDVQINQYLIKHFLAGSQCTLQFVDNGKKAVEQAAEGTYDLVLMDIQMPEMDGLEATKNIRCLADKKKASVPIIALTANALKGTDAVYLAAGMNAYLSKPFTKEALLQTIEQTLKAQAATV